MSSGKFQSDCNLSDHMHIPTLFATRTLSTTPNSSSSLPPHYWFKDLMFMYALCLSKGELVFLQNLPCCCDFLRASSICITICYKWSMNTCFVLSYRIWSLMSDTRYHKSLLGDDSFWQEINFFLHEPLKQWFKIKRSLTDTDCIWRGNRFSLKGIFCRSFYAIITDSGEAGEKGPWPDLNWGRCGLWSTS